MKILRRAFVILVILTPWTAIAQGVTDFYQLKPGTGRNSGLRAGINYSIPVVTPKVGPRPFQLVGVIPSYGFYIGESYYRYLLPDQLLFRLDATFQQKNAGAGVNGKLMNNANYYYIGITPLIGLHLTDNLLVYTGFDANLLIGKYRPWGKGYPFEVGTSFRINYLVGRFGLEVNYFRGFTRFDRFELPAVPGEYNDFYNQSIQVGLLYLWNRKPTTK